MKTIKYKKKLYLLDIGLLILLLMKLSKIIIGIKIMAQDKQKNKNILITICASGAFFWFCFFIHNTNNYTLITALEAIITVVMLSILAVYIIFKGIYNVVNLTILYSIFLIVVGFIDALIDMNLFGNSNFSPYVVSFSIACETFYILVGIILLYNIKNK